MPTAACFRLCSWDLTWTGAFSRNAKSSEYFSHYTLFPSLFLVFQFLSSFFSFLTLFSQYFCQCSVSLLNFFFFHTFFLIILWLFFKSLSLGFRYSLINYYFITFLYLSSHSFNFLFVPDIKLFNSNYLLLILLVKY